MDTWVCALPCCKASHNRKNSSPRLLPRRVGPPPQPQPKVVSYAEERQTTMIEYGSRQAGYYGEKAATLVVVGSIKMSKARYLDSCYSYLVSRKGLLWFWVLRSTFDKPIEGFAQSAPGGV